MFFIRRYAVLGLFATLILAGGNNAAAIAPPGKSVPARQQPAAAASEPSALKGSSNLIFDDARTLMILIAEHDDQNISAILQAYGVDVHHIQEAPFLNQVSYFKPKTKVKSFTPPAHTPPGGLVTPQGAAPTGLFSPSSVANALGTLIATRFKQDAELLAIHNLARRMLRIDHEEPGKPLSVGLPKTMNYIWTLKHKPNDPADTSIRPIEMHDWTIIQSSFKSDMAGLGDNMPKFIDALYSNRANISARYLAWLASSTAEQVLKNGRKPYQTFDAVADASTAFATTNALTSAPDAATAVDVNVGLQAFTVLSHMLASDSSGNWHSASQLEQLLHPDSCNLTCDDGLYLLLGLSYARDKDSYAVIDAWLAASPVPPLLPSNHTDQAALANPPLDIDNLRRLMNGLPPLLTALRQVSKDVSDLPNPIRDIAQVKPLISDFGRVSGAAVDSLQAFFPPSLPDSKPAACDQFCNAKNLLSQSTSDLGSLVDIVGDLQTKQYPAAIGEVIVYVRRPQVDNSGPMSNFLTDNGAFIAAVASAKSQADLQAALDDYALPAGSYAQQQHTGFSVTLNGFFGVAASAETLTGSSAGTNVSRTRARLGFAAPVGLDFNFGRVTNETPPSNRFFDTGAWSIFVPILDVGAVASWRLGSGGGSVPAITWQNIVAPGLYAVWSKRDSPFAVLIGGQYGPELRKISTAGGATIERAALQFPCIEFTFNIPIFNLYQPSPSDDANESNGN